MKDPALLTWLITISVLCLIFCCVLIWIGCLLGNWIKRMMIFKDFYSNGTFSGQGNLLIENLLTTYLADPSNAAKLALAMSDTNSNTKERDPARDDVDPKTQQGDDREQVDPKKQQGDQDRVETKSAETDTDDRTQKS